MWPFKRKQADEMGDVPNEVQEYYQAEHRERMGVAWLLAFVTLAVTVAVVLGLFFGGRALYHKFHHNNKPVATAPQPKTGMAPAPKATEPSTKPKTSNPRPVTSQPKKTTSPGTVAAPGPSVTTQPKNNSQTITNTGPSGTVAAFVAASIIGFAGYELRLRKKLLAL